MAASTPIIPFATWASGTNSNSIPANDNALRLQLLEGNILSLSTTAQPGSPSTGDAYILAATHTGTQWATFNPNDLVIYSGGTWYAYGPVTGLVVNVAGTLYRYTGSAWTAVVASGSGATIPQNSQSTAYTLVASDAGKHILHPSADTTARTFTIPANSSVPFNIGDAVTFINQNGAGVVTIAITSDTMRLAGAGTTGSRTLAANGMATAVKVTSTEWIISGTGLS